MGLQHAKRLGLLYIWVESDSMVLINLINGLTVPPWSVMHVFRDIKKLLCDFHEVIFTHIYREGNWTADIMANWIVTNKALFEVEDLQHLPRRKEERVYSTNSDFQVLGKVIVIFFFESNMHFI